MGRDLLLLRHGFQLSVGKYSGRFHQTTDPQTETLKTIRHQRIKLGRLRHGAVWPEIRRDVLLRQLTIRVPPFGQGVEWPHHELADLLNDTRMPDGERRG